jgi:hypothetical protein
VRESEGDACKALSQAASAKFLALGCVSTTAACPDLLQAETGTPCLQYDAGSVEGCVTLFDQQSSCAALSDATQSCVPYYFTGSAPNGC